MIFFHVGLVAETDNEYLMIDSTAMCLHHHGVGPAGGQLA